MSLIVTKFGGTSVATPARICDVAKRLVEYHNAGHQVVAVVSAMGKHTDELLELATSVNQNPPSRELDNLLSTGEQVSMAVLALAIDALGVDAISLTGSQAGIVTNASFSKARIAEIHADRIKGELASSRIVVVAGFQGITPEGDITTLGRGGSDTTAVALAAGLEADVCEIYSDVDGIYTADPRRVLRAHKLAQISYEEMLELASAGAPVLQARAVEVARNFNVVLHCRNAFSNVIGTYVRKVEDMEAAIVSGIASDNSESKITIRGVPDRVGIAAEVFSELAAAGINVDMIVQNVGENGTTDISFTCPKSDSLSLQPIMSGLESQLGIRGYSVTEDIAKLSLVGAGMKSHPGIAARMFKVLSEHAINIDMISTSPIRISVVIDETRMEEALFALHTAFELDSDQVFEETQLSAEELEAKKNKGR